VCLHGTIKEKGVRGAMKNQTVDKLWNVMICIGLGGLVVFFSVMFSMFLVIAQRNNDHSFTTIDSFALCLFCLFSSFILLRLSQSLDLFFFDLKFLTKRNIQIILTATISLLILSVLESVLIDHKVIIEKALNPLDTQVLSTVPLVIIVLFTFVLSPIMEEVVFRGGIIGLVFKDHAFLGVGVSSILYSILLQPETFICGLLYLLVNGILGLAYVKTGKADCSAAYQDKCMSDSIFSHIVNGMAAALKK
jgi:uncharacterized protein